MKNFLGIDIGLKGGLSIVSEDGELLECKPIPTIEVLVGKKIRNQYDIQSVYFLLVEWEDKYKIDRACMERLRAIPNQSSQTGFSMGGGTMLFKTILTVLAITYSEIEPRAWQKAVFGEFGIQYTKDTTKKASIQAAKQLFPKQDFRTNERCRTANDGMTDSACIAYYLIKK